MLGLGFLDAGAGLTAGSAYDYRVIGRFRRRDVAERLLGFQTVPVGTALPATFALGDVLLTTPSGRRVEMTPSAGPADLEVTGRKGIRLDDQGFFGGSLRIELPTPVMRIALDVDPGHSLKYTADASATLIGVPAGDVLGRGARERACRPGLRGAGGHHHARRRRHVLRAAHRGGPGRRPR